MNRPAILIAAALGGAFILAGVLGWEHIVSKPSVTRLLDVLGKKESTISSAGPAVSGSKSSGVQAKSPAGAATADGNARRQPARQPQQPQDGQEQERKADTPRQADAGDARDAGEAKETAATARKPEQQNGNKPAPPTFDVVRVEPDGMAVLAGRAAPRAKVELLLDGTVVATVTADENGEWAFAPDKPLFKDAHQLTLRARGAASAPPVVSPQTLTVSMKAAQRGGRPMVLLASPDAPTRVLQKPPVPDQGAARSRKARQPAMVADAAAGRQAQTAATDTGKSGQGRNASAGPAAGASAGGSMPGPVPEQSTARVALSLQTVDYDSDGAIFFTGRSTAGAALRLYVDNRHLADVRADAAGNWVWRGQTDMKPGRHDLRIDRLDATGKVLERIELPFVRATPQAVAAARAAEAGHRPAGNGLMRQADVRSMATAGKNAAASERSQVKSREVSVATLASPPPPTGKRPGDKTQQSAPAEEGNAASAAGKTPMPATQQRTQLSGTAAGSAAEEAADTRQKVTAGLDGSGNAGRAATGNAVASAATDTRGNAAGNRTGTAASIAASTAAKGTAGAASSVTTGAITDSVRVEESTTSGTMVASAGDAYPDSGSGTARSIAEARKGIIIVQPGNNLWNIARVLYGKGVRYTTIYEANREQIRDPNLIYPGQVFAAPGVPGRKLRINPRRRRPATPDELQDSDMLR